MIEEQQQWRLRELLSSRRELTLFGATTRASDGIYGSERAFFEFFQIQTLPPLTAAEVRSLLLKLSESVEEKESEKGTAKRRVTEWLGADGARLHTLVQLPGGNPRTAVLLFHLVLDGLQGGAREYLEQLLDQVTPNYKGRVDELSPQAQQVLDAAALHWDPVTAAEVSAESGLEAGVVSTQLTRLVRQGILEKADPGDSKRALYQVAERFFNIWYLMRASRRVRAKLRWFVEFLRVFSTTQSWSLSPGTESNDTVRSGGTIRQRSRPRSHICLPPVRSVISSRSISDRTAPISKRSGDPISN
ncbi:MAG: MarR family transcriptional regulator [Bryobacteraceae bacterium]